MLEHLVSQRLGIDQVMAVLRFIGQIFLWPGDVVRRALGINLEQDSGVLRSFINSVFWGVVALLIALKYF